MSWDQVVDVPKLAGQGTNEPATSALVPSKPVGSWKAPAFLAYLSPSPPAAQSPCCRDGRHPSRPSPTRALFSCPVSPLFSGKCSFIHSNIMARGGSHILPLAGLTSSQIEHGWTSKGHEWTTIPAGPPRALPRTQEPRPRVPVSRWC